MQMQTAISERQMNEGGVKFPSSRFQVIQAPDGGRVLRIKPPNPGGRVCGWDVPPIECELSLNSAEAGALAAMLVGGQ